MAKRLNEMQEWARIGAEARIRELQSEIDRIRTQFPTERGRKGGQIRSGRGGAIIGSGWQGGRGWSAPAEEPVRRKRKLSAAGRKAISEAAKARWARHKAANGAGGETSGPKKGGKKR